MKLYRPVGLNELRKMVALGLRAFPPRLPEQPIFYPVMNVEYARQIARDWNTKDEPYAGFVTAFDVDDAYVAKFEVQTVGARRHQELWVPAEELDEFNRHIQDRIEILEFYVGPKFEGAIDPETRMPVGWASTKA